MKLVSLTKKGDVQIADLLVAVSGVFEGQSIEVKQFVQPNEQHREGLVKFNVAENGSSWQSLLPRVLNCLYVPNDSVLSSISYDNEKTLAVYLAEIVTKLEKDNREARRFIVGDKEMTRIEHVLKSEGQDGMGFAYRSFNGVRVSEFKHYDTLLVVEHAPKVVEQDGVKSE